MQREIFITKDNSLSVFVPQLNVSYHSKYGALQESLHVFIEAGLAYYTKKHKPTYVSIFEMGLGTALNALLTENFATNHHLTIHYTAIELYPLTSAEYNALHYDNLSTTLLQQIHTTNWEKPINLSPHFTLTKVKQHLLQFTTTERFNIIYYDAFAPAAQPELWTKKVFIQLYHLLQNNGILVTYCSKGEVRRNLLAAGFDVEKLPGPPGKREMLRAIKP
jgi:tRNA U34 5-methylaminomethyl-2-thiouridine-forming methyltransferase MnmC